MTLEVVKKRVEEVEAETRAVVVVIPESLDISKLCGNTIASNKVISNSSRSGRQLSHHQYHAA